MDQAIFRQWAHSPAHFFAQGRAYIVTAGTCQKKFLFDTPEKRDFLLQTLFEEAEKYKWGLQAWAVMSNHYHFVAQAPDKATTLKNLITALHSKTAIWLNKLDAQPGRKIWFQYRDTCLTYERSYLARLHYVHNNPVKHRLAENAENYPWCSMCWFVRNATPGLRQTVCSFNCEHVKIEDDF